MSNKYNQKCLLPISMTKKILWSIVYIFTTDILINHIEGMLCVLENYQKQIILQVIHLHFPGDNK